MKEFDGRRFAETVFSDEWKTYLAEYGIEAKPDEWLYRTISQAYEGLIDSDRAFLTGTLVKPLPVHVFAYQPLSKRYLSLFDEMLEPCFLQKLSVYTTREIFSNYIAVKKERRAAFEENGVRAANVLSFIDTEAESVVAKANDALLLQNQTYNSLFDESIIDVSGEGQVISITNDDSSATTILEEAAYDNENWKLGTRYQHRLGLNETDVEWLNKFWDPSNSFLSVEGCCIEVIRLYLLCLNEMVERFTSNNSNFLEQVGKFILQNQSKRAKYYSVEQFEQYVESHIYNTFFKRAESAVREAYKHKRKINDAFLLSELSGSFERRFGRVWNELVEFNKSNISLPDTATELRLNEMNVNRWKLFFDEITVGISDTNFEDCAFKLDELAMQNARNPAVENIYYEASKLSIKRNKLTALKFYLKYIHADLNSDKVDNRQLGKSIQKSLFSTEEQLRNFEEIINQLIKTKDLPAALLKAPDVYAKRRKRIELDRASIEHIKTQHASTVGRLNDMLHEEEESEVKVLLSTAADEIELQIISPTPANEAIVATDVISFGIQLNEHQISLLHLFGENNFQLEEHILSNYAKTRNLFKNQLIESVNDCCYEELDDVLIEESGEGYEVNEYYYHKIINLC